MYNNKSDVLTDMVFGEIVASFLHNFIDGLYLNWYQRDSLHQIVSMKSNFDRANNMLHLLFNI